MASLHDPDRYTKSRRGKGKGKEKKKKKEKARKVKAVRMEMGLRGEETTSVKTNFLKKG